MKYLTPGGGGTGMYQFCWKSIKVVIEGKGL